MSITDLTNTTWIFKNTLSSISEYSGSEWRINFNSNLNSYTRMRIQAESFNTQFILRYRAGTYTSVYTLNTSWQTSVWNSPQYQIITITGGNDVENTSLISFLEDNAEQETLYLTSDAELKFVANSIRSKASLNTPLEYPNEYVSAINNIVIPTPIYTLISSTELTVSTTSTTASSAGTVTLSSTAYTSNKVLYIQIRDKAGIRQGYFIGSDSYIFNPYPVGSLTTTVNNIIKAIHRTDSNGVLSTYASGTTVGYGVYPYSLDSGGSLEIYKRYNSSYSGTVNGTYVINVYTIDYIGDYGNPYTYNV